MELGVLHQRYGSGLQQRGLSLTSTPRRKGLVGNDAAPFRTPGGVRITVDLFKAPLKVILLNHYSSGGIKDAVAGAIRPDVLGPPEDAPEPKPGERDEYKYDYRGSVTKNREIYLERLEPSWICAIDVYGADGAVQHTLRREGPAIVGKAGELLGHKPYGRGFAQHEVEADRPGSAAGVRARDSYELGFWAGRQFRVAVPRALRCGDRAKAGFDDLPNAPASVEPRPDLPESTKKFNSDPVSWTKPLFARLWTNTRDALPADTRLGPEMVWVAMTKLQHETELDYRIGNDDFWRGFADGATNVVP